MRPANTAPAHWPAVQALLTLSSPLVDEPESLVACCKNLSGQGEKVASISLLVSEPCWGWDPKSRTTVLGLGDESGTEAREAESKSKIRCKRSVAWEGGPEIVTRRSPTEHTKSTWSVPLEPGLMQVLSEDRVPRRLLRGGGRSSRPHNGKSKGSPQSPKKEGGQSKSTTEPKHEDQNKTGPSRLGTVKGTAKSKEVGPRTFKENGGYLRKTLEHRSLSISNHSSCMLAFNLVDPRCFDSSHLWPWTQSCSLPPRQTSPVPQWTVPLRPQRKGQTSQGRCSVHKDQPWVLKA